MFSFDTFMRSRFRKPSEVTALLRSYNAVVLPSDASVAKWFQRGVVPSEWFAVLLAYLELDEGQPIRLAQYLTGKS